MLKIEAILGQGAGGAVYKARQSDPDRTVAVKVFEGPDPGFLEGFANEARVTDPHIVQIHEVGSEGGRSFLVMEFVDGEPLSRRLESRRRLTVGEALGLMEQSLEALAALHEADILHRDLKPSNLLIDAKGNVKMTYIGPARPDGADVLSPEQARREPLTARSDLFSLGAIFYQVLTGQLPFAAPTPGSLIQYLADDRPATPVRAVNLAVPAALSRWISRMTAKDPARRHAGAREALEELRRIRPEIEAAPARPAAVAEPVEEGWPAWVAPAAVAAALLAVMGAIYIWKDPRESPPSEVKAPITAPPPPVAAQPKPPPSDPPELAEALALIGGMKWAEADDAYGRIKTDFPPLRARVDRLRESLRVFRVALEQLEKMDVDMTASALSLFRSQMGTDMTAEERSGWTKPLTVANERLADIRRWSGKLTLLDSLFPRQLQGAVIGSQAGELMREFRTLPEDHPARRRFEEWLAKNLQIILDAGAEALAKGSIPQCRIVFNKLKEHLPGELERAQVNAAWEKATGPMMKPESVGAKVGWVIPFREVPLEFVPSDFIVDPEGRRLIALNRAGSELVVQELERPEPPQKVAVGPEPSCVAWVGNRVVVGSRLGADLRIIDPARWFVESTIKLPWPEARTLAVAWGVEPPRLFVALSGGIAEIDVAARTVKSSRPLSPGPAWLVATPDGERLYTTSGGVSVYGTDRALTPMGPTPSAKAGYPYEAQGAAAMDGQGQYLVVGSALYDRRFQWVKGIPASVLPRTLVGHPLLPYMVLAGTGAQGIELEFMDLYALAMMGRLAVLPALEPPARPPGQRETVLRMVTAPDARSVLVGEIQSPTARGEVFGPGRIDRVALPMSPPPSGYFAFTGTPPAHVEPGFSVSYRVRLSKPFEERAKVRVEYAPEGTKWIPSQRMLVWTPSLQQCGRQEIRLSAEDPGSGRTISQKIDVVVRLRRPFEGDGRLRPVLAADGKFAYAVTEQAPATVHVYDVETGRTSRFEAGFKPVHAGVAHGRLYAIDPGSLEIVSWRLPAGDDRQARRLEGMKPLALFGPAAGGGMVAGASNASGVTHLVSTESGLPLMPMRSGGGVAISPDGALMAAQDQGPLKLFRWQDGGYQAGVTLPSHPYAVRFSHDGTHLAFGGQLFAVEGMRLAHTFGGEGLRFDPEGPYLATASGNTIDVFRLDDLERAASIVVPPQAVDRNGTNPISITWAVPLSKRNLIVIGFASENMALVPHKF